MRQLPQAPGFEGPQIVLVTKVNFTAFFQYAEVVFVKFLIHHTGYTIHCIMLFFMF